MEGSDYIGLLRRMTERIMSKAFHPFHYFSLTFHSFNSFYNMNLPGRVKRMKRFLAFFHHKDYLTNSLDLCAMIFFLSDLIQPFIVHLLILTKAELIYYLRYFLVFEKKQEKHFTHFTFTPNFLW